ncbi:hypothetical protein BCR44DRAFT_41403 [Catenaria anguillulae PL171]|uniref:Uncharacterized protein n=1 Tax=Catenaria anguillulae PL171 TaxID=765915 RepID=A0A1Y2HUL3_9FUNG|nr:hypothetical protein BCR44DRAFT_41403 [Catenaria anguillulae PL171]
MTVARNAPRVKRTCCGGFLIREGVLCLLAIQLVLSLICLILSALVLYAFTSATESKRPDGLTDIIFSNDAVLTGSVASKQQGVILFAVLTGQFAFSALWVLVGYVSARRRIPKVFLAFMAVQLVVSIGGFAYGVVAQGWTWSQAVITALHLYWSYVYYRYGTSTMPKEIEEEQEIKRQAGEGGETEAMV